MNQIQSKVYYEILTGEVLIITSEMEGSVEPTTKEHDMEIHEQLKNYDINEVDFIELKYGTLADTFKNIKSYSVDVKSKKLNCVYYTQEELDEQKKQQEQQVQETEQLNSRVSDISQYLNINTQTISDVEDLILQSEQNKILNSEGMI